MNDVKRNLLLSPLGFVQKVADGANIFVCLRCIFFIFWGKKVHIIINFVIRLNNLVCVAKILYSSIYPTISMSETIEETK